MDVQLTNVQTTDDLVTNQEALAAEEADNSVDQDMFLTLMITQLQYQNPLDPMDNDQFINQLALLTQVEQLESANVNLDELEVGQQAINNSTMVNLVGQEVKAIHSGFTYAGEGEHDLNFELESNSSTATITVYDEAGSLVHSETQTNLEAGPHVYTWDGLTDDGIYGEEGQYTFKVSAVDGEGTSIAVNHYLVGTIDELDYSAGFAIPIVDEQVLSFDQIVSLVNPEDEVVDGEESDSDTDSGSEKVKVDSSEYWSQDSPVQ